MDTEDLLIEAQLLLTRAAQDQNLPIPKKQSLNVANLGIDRVINYLQEQREWAEKLKARK